MSFFDMDGAGNGHPHADKAARERMRLRSERWRKAIVRRSEWPSERFQEEDERLAKEIEAFEPKAA
ncbi:hypothetical protein [uncultured Ruegeria sp.]|uniref:hypothetical protein n=1 Tax=uncultured Ruegeria sp. TaxID=259304 RepID=UPI00262349F0|nr:hypothetical protein [uncultured Ruegeria sp.]